MTISPAPGKWLGPSLIAALATSCAHAPPASVAALPPVPAYDAQFTAEFAEQYERLVPAGTALDTFILDAITLRCAVMAARGQPLPGVCTP